MIAQSVDVGQRVGGGERLALGRGAADRHRARGCVVDVADVECVVRGIIGSTGEGAVVNLDRDVETGLGFEIQACACPQPQCVADDLEACRIRPGQAQSIRAQGIIEDHDIGDPDGGGRVRILR